MYACLLDELLDERYVVFGSVPDDGRLGAQRLELTRGVAQYVDTNIGVP